MTSPRARGSAILTILLLMVVVFTATSTYTSLLSSNASANGSSFAKRRTFYAAESTRYVILKLLQSYLASVIVPDAADMTAYLNSLVPSRMPDGYQIQNLTVAILSANEVATIANGALKGMYAPQSIVRLSYDVQSKGVGGITNLDYTPLVSLEVTLSLAQVGMFEFMYFIDLDFADFSPGPITKIKGRVHSNGDLCLTAATSLTFSNLTSAGKLMFGTDSRCAYKRTGDNVYISTTASITGPSVKLSSNNGDGCTNCAGSGMGWAAYAPATWKGNLLDSAHDVSPLSLPVPTNIQTQLGSDRDDPYTGPSNNRDLRFIIDPVNTWDSDDVARIKFAYKADVRIISGIWYLRNAADPRKRGTPIWSDHPGTFIDELGTPVGQADLRKTMPTSGRWALGGTPRLFSYYEYEYTPALGTGAMKDDLGTPRGVISYGNLIPQTAAGVTSWHPGHWLSGTGAKNICPLGSFKLNAATPFVDAFDPNAYDCLLGLHPGFSTNILNATRSGIHDGHIYKLYPSPATTAALRTAEMVARARVLTTNFDVEQFQAALQNTTPGELGSYFGAGNLMNAPFNGIVYISNTWTGFDRGYSPPDSPVAPPIQDPAVNKDPSQIDVTGPMQQRALPYPLCTTQTGSTLVPQPNKPFDGANLFKIPDCAAYGPSKMQAYPSAIRVINGYALDPAKLPSGLSIASSVGMYLQGEYNTKSDTSSETATPWLPALVAADQVLYLSNAWNDQNAAWNDTTHSPNLRFAWPTTYNSAVITGWARSANSMPLHAFPAMMEDWNSPKAPYTGQVPITFNGSIVMGFYPVYEREGRWWDAAGYTYLSGPRYINFDRHFMYTKNQPPGSPLFYVSAVLDWKTH